MKTKRSIICEMCRTHFTLLSILSAIGLMTVGEGLSADLKTGLVAYYDFQETGTAGLENKAPDATAHHAERVGDEFADWLGGANPTGPGFAGNDAYDGGNGLSDRSTLIVGNALNLADDRNEFVRIPLGTPQLGQSFTIAAWHFLAPGADNTSARFFVFEAADAGNYDISWGTRTSAAPDGPLAAHNYAAWLASGNELVVNGLAAGTWHHVAHVFRQSGVHTRMTVFVNGVAVGERTALTSAMDFSAIHLGDARSGRDDDRIWDGMIDEVALWTRALRTDEVTALHSLGLAGQTVLDHTPDSCGFAGGTGIPGDPFLIESAHHLNEMRNRLAADYRLVTDIDLGVAPWNDGVGWIPIGGTDAGERFTGSYDGGGFAIRNLKIDRFAVANPTGTTYVGLFRYLDGATVRNVNLENADVRGSTYTGALAGYANASLMENIQVGGQVVGGGHTGGLAGQLGANCALNYVAFDGSVAGGDSTGGLVGSTVSGSTIRYAWTEGSVQGASSVGGLIGYFRTSWSGTNCSLADAFSRASVAGGSNVGGAIGYQYYSNVSRAYSSGPVTGTGSYIGGFLGRNAGSATLRDCYWDTESSGLATSAGGSGVAGRSSSEMKQQATFRNFNFFTAWQIDDGHDSPRFRDLAVHAAPATLTLGDLAGEGTAASPYLIHNASELHAMRLDLAAHYRLENDIDLAASVTWDAGRGWVPVGVSSAASFAGKLDGAGFTIRNLTINRPPTSYQGLFGYLGAAKVRDLRIEDASVYGNSYTGTLAGHTAGSSVENVHANGEINGTSNTGGLAGHLASATDLNFVSYSGSVVGGDNTGGLIGSTGSGSRLRHVWTTGSVRGASSVGGLIGYFRPSYSGTNCSLADAYSRASVAGVSNVGGAIGYQYYSNVSRTYSSGPVTGTGSYIGGFLGRNAASTTHRDCHWDIESSGLATSAGGFGVVGRSSSEMRQQATFLNYNFFTIWRIEEGVDYPRLHELGVNAGPAAIVLTELGGDGSAQFPYLITSADELHAMHQDLAAHYRLANDIDLAGSAFWDGGRGWLPVGGSISTPFTGTLDGAGHTIRNLSINRLPTNDQGLFGCLSGAVVMNLNLENASVRGNNLVGALAGYANASNVRNVRVAGEVTGENHTGGLIGQLGTSCELNHTSFSGWVYGGNSTGGLVGSTVSGSSIRYVWTEGSVRGGTSVGGLIGSFRPGFSGANCSLADAFSRAAVAGVSEVGGAIGYQYYSNVSRVFSTGVVSGTGSHTGGFLGRAAAESTLRDCFWDMDVSGLLASAGGSGVVGLISSEMKQRASFPNFNFFTVWRIDEGIGYPRFRGPGAHAAPMALSLDDLAGLGTEESPYLITTADELHAMRLDLAAHYRMENDIDLSVSAYWDSGRGWIPVGVSSASSFSGVLDGAGHTIRNLTINRPPTNFQGLFGYINGGEVRDLRLETASIRGNAYTATLAGYAAAATFENVHAGGDVTGSGNTGGLIGQLGSFCDLNYTSFSGWVHGGNNTGGLVGSTVSGSSIRYVWTEGSVQGGSPVGGLIGNFRTSFSGTNCSLADAYTRAAVAGVSEVGGAIGYQYYSNVSRVFSTGVVSATGSYIGGFLGRIGAESTLRDCYWDMDASGQPASAGGSGVSGLDSTQTKQRASFLNFNFFTAWRMDEGIGHPRFRDLGVHAAPAAVTLDDLAGLGTEEFPYLITHADELNAMRLNLAAHYRLENDIDLSASVYWDAGRGWVPVGTFTGVLDGAGHAIRNLTINRPPTSYQGLFGNINGGKVSDLRLETASIRGNTHTASLAGYVAAATLENIHASGEVTGGGHTGGLIGQISTSGLDRAGFAGSVDGGDNTGGLIGSTVSGSVIRRVWTLGSVSGASSVGGLVGAFRPGFSGTNCSLADAYSRASVSGTSNVGGALGYQYYSSVSRTYSSGSVTGTGSFVGGFLGREFSDSSQALCHWDTESSGQATSGGGTGVVGRTSTQMRQQATFANWNFADTWEIEEGLAYPSHRELAAQIGLSPADRSHRDDASAGHVVEVVANAAWTAATDEPWITITGGSSGRDDGAVVYSLAANPLPVARHGVITVTAADGGSRDFHVHQEALLGISPAFVAHDAPASSGHAVHVAGNVAWSAQASDSWIQITTGASGADDGLLVYSVLENTSLDPRSGTITISGGGIDRVIEIHQGGAAPYLGISPEWAEHPAGGAAGQAITVTANTAWTAASDSLWITVVGGGSGTGDGTVTYQVAATGEHSPRVGHVTVSDGTRSLLHRVFQVPQGSVRIDIIDSPSGAGLFAGFGQYRTGERVTLDAWNSASHTFVSWSDGAGVVSTHPQLVFTAQAPRTLTANYELRVHTLVYHGSGEGWIEGEPLQFVQHGGNGSPVRAVPNSGHVFIEWSDGVTANPRADTNVSSDIEITALFLEIPEGHHALVYLAGAGGSIDGISPQIVESGGTGTPVGVVPSAGAAFHQWSDGSTANPRVDENVEADIEVTAHFRSTGGVDIDWYLGHGIFPGEGQTWADLDGMDRFGKGMTLREEFIATTDPNDPQSRFATDAPARIGTTVEIHLQPSSPDRRYTLWRSTNLADWSPVPGQTGIPGGNGPLVDDAPPAGNAFYRVEAALP